MPRQIDDTPTPAPVVVSTRERRNVRVAARSVDLAESAPPLRRSRARAGGVLRLAALAAVPVAVWFGRGSAEVVPTKSLSAGFSAVAEHAVAAAAALGAGPRDLSAALIAAEPIREADAPAQGASAPSPVARADDHLNRDGRHASIHGGVLFAPRDFASADGTYDLYLHFHGNTRVVLESVEHVHLNALVAIVNLGIGSGPYEEAYSMPGSYQGLLDSIARAATARGLATPHVRRIAIGSWSAGYGAVGAILSQKGGHDGLDALLMLDGIHVGYVDESAHELKKRNLLPFIDAAKEAARGDLFFTITHSSVIPDGYASTTETADLLLDEVGGRRDPVDPRDAPEHVVIEAAKGAVAKALEKDLEPTTEARVGGLHVRGYRGVTPEHHMSHLLQMAATVLPELAARWR